MKQSHSFVSYLCNIFSLYNGPPSVKKADRNVLLLFPLTSIYFNTEARSSFVTGFKSALSMPIDFIRS